MTPAASGSEQAAVFLDRDGTILDEDGYLGDPDGVRLLPGAGEAIHRFNRAGLLVIVVTNQSGIARGLLSEADLAAVHHRMEALLADAGARVDGSFHCPHHPELGPPDLRRACDCRKPAPGMILRAIEEHGIDPSRSALIGDAERDLEAGRRAGVPRLVLVTTGKGAATWNRLGSEERDAIEYVPDLAAAAELICGPELAR